MFRFYVEPLFIPQRFSFSLWLLLTPAFRFQVSAFTPLLPQVVAIA